MERVAAAQGFVLLRKDPEAASPPQAEEKALKELREKAKTGAIGGAGLKKSGK